MESKGWVDAGFEAGCYDALMIAKAEQDDALAIRHMMMIWEVW